MAILKPKHSWSSDSKTGNLLPIKFKSSFLLKIILGLGLLKQIEVMWKWSHGIFKRDAQSVKYCIGNIHSSLI